MSIHVMKILGDLMLRRMKLSVNKNVAFKKRTVEQSEIILKENFCLKVVNCSS